MQPTICSRCHKNVDVLFITELKTEKQRTRVCVLKPKELKIKPLRMLYQMGITDEDLRAFP